jgi:hypothetical protein
MTVVQRISRCPISRRDTYVLLVPARTASSSCVRPARVRRSLSARPRKVRELLLVIDWPREHPALEAEVEIDQFGETLLSGLQAELLTQRYLITAPRNGSKLRKEATRAVAIIERFLADLDAGRLALRCSVKRTITSRMVERAIVLQLTRNDHSEQWCRAELERTLHDVEALAVNDALERLSALGVIDLDGEHATASESVRYLDRLGMVSV